jgi:hypothetical protein
VNVEAFLFTIWRPGIYDAQHRPGMTFDNVPFDSLKEIKVLAEQADFPIPER